MILTSLIIVGVFLLIISLIDIYTHKIPAFLTTAFIFIIVVVSLNDINFGIVRLSFGVLGLLFGLMIYEFDFIGGIADIKAIILISILILTINYFIAFMVLIMVVGLIYKILWKLITKDPKHKEIPFIPVFFIVYLLMILIGGIV
jgi:prepilin signal peptidase PulO-like enzyme (type II secretory pathway)